MKRPVPLLILGGLLALAPAARAGFVIKVQTPDGACPEQIRVTLDGVPARAERKAGCNWWLEDDAEEALLVVRAAGYLEEIRRLDVEPHPAGSVAIRLTPSDDLLAEPSDGQPAAEAAGQGHGHSHGGDGAHGHTHGGDEAVAVHPVSVGKSAAETVSGTLAMRWRPDAWQADAPLPGGAFGRTVNNRVRESAVEMRLRTALFGDRLFLNAVYTPVWWDERAVYEPPAQPGLTGRSANGPHTDALAPRTDHVYGLGLRWLPTPNHELAASLHVASTQREGLLHGAGDRLSPVVNPGINASADDVPPGFATNGSTLSDSRTAELRYTFRFRGWEAGLWVRDFNSRYAERPAPGADRPMYVDLRRDQVHVIQALNYYQPTVPLEQVRFGGYGLYTEEAGALRRTWGARLAGRFGAGDRITTELRAQRASATLRERQLRSGRRGEEEGLLVYLADNFFGPLPGSVVRIQGGVSGAVICRSIEPRGANLLDACPDRQFLVTRGEIGPPPADLQVRTDRIEWINRWQGKRQSLSLTLTARRDSVADPTDFTLLSAVTGEPLIGSNRYPVGTHDPDVPPPSVFSPSPPRLIAGPGRFIGGRYQFPIEPGWKIEWQQAIGASDRLTASWSRSPEDVPDELLHHLFEAKLSVIQGFYQYPDQTGQAGHTFAEGGAVSRVAPGTRLGSRDDFRLAWQAGGWLPLSLSVELFHRRQHRILAQTQSNPLENVVNRELDIYFYADAVGGSNFCRNCTPGQLSAFPNYVPGVDANSGDPNPDSRGFLSLMLANPGHNTDPALFGTPKRNSYGLRFSATRHPKSGGHLTARLSAQWSRTRGNYEGMQFVGDDQGHPEPRTIFSYPISTLTRSQYANGPLPEEFPNFARLDLRWERLWIKGLTAAITAEWREGSLRTPWLAQPLSSWDGNLPGSAPDYYLMDMDLNGTIDRVVLRDFTPARRGALGRNDSQLRFDFALLYRQPRGRPAWRAGVAVINLVNSRPVSARDDRLETSVAFHRDVAPSGQEAPHHGASLVDITTRIANPDYGRPYRQSPPRTVQLLFAIDF